jgi:hypothetical protein
MELKNFNHRFKTDPEREIKGVEIHVGEDFYVTVARAGNRASQAKYREMMSEPSVAVAVRAGNLSDAKMTSIVSEIRATCILVGWRGLTENGKEIPYSVEKARELLAIPDFAARIAEWSETQELFREQSIEQASDALGKV